MTPLLPAAAPRWRELGGVIALTLVWLAASAGLRPLMLPDEGRYVGVAWEMIRSGDWLTPTLNGLPYFHKPPLFYWITVGALGLFGPTEWGARAAPILGASLGAVATYVFLRRWWGRRAARLSLLALLVQPLYFVAAQFANLDMLAAGCITATIVLLADAAMCIEWRLPHRRALAAAYAMAAIGVLAKGLIGLLIPVLVVGAWVLLLRRWRVLAGLPWWPGVALFLLLAAPWFVAMQWRHPAFLNYFFGVQHFQRFAGGGFNNVQPFWFLPAVLLLLSLPLLPWLTRPFRHGFLSDAEREPERSPVRLLLVVWVGVVLLFFSLPQSKLVGYVLPAVPPLAMLAADGYLMARSMPAQRALWLWRAGISLAALVSVGVVVAVAVYPQPSSRSIALALKAQHRAPEPVVMLGSYPFDLPFYARLTTPVVVVDDWPGALASSRDNWRKELADAGRFAPLQATATLIGADDLTPRLCAAPVSWLVGDSKQAEVHRYLALAHVVQRSGSTTLWRLDRSLPAVSAALGCTHLPPARWSER